MKSNGNSRLRYFWYVFIHMGKTFVCLKYTCHIIYHLLPNVWKALYTISPSIFVDVPCWTPNSTDNFVSCVVPVLSLWRRDRNHILVEYSGCSRISHCQRRKIAIIAAAVWLLALSWRTVGAYFVVFFWVHAITISSPKWKNYCERSGTTQEMNLSVLYGGQYGTWRKMDALMVYDSFHTFVKMW